jgi:probable rRNA maturation factor
MIVLHLSEAAQPLFSPAELDQLTQAAGDLLPNQHTWEIDIDCISDDEIRQINLEYRHKDVPTDVLTFPTVLVDDYLDAPAMAVVLGSIVIAPLYAQAAGTPLIELVAHGLLHLQGLDHEQDRAGWNNAEQTLIQKAESQGLFLVGLQNAQPFSDTKDL